MKKKLSKIWGVGLAGVLAISLVIVGAPLENSEVKAALPTGAAISSICFVDAAGTGGDIYWSDDEASAGTYSVMMDGGTQTGAVYVAVVWQLDGTMDLDEITEFEYTYNFPTAGSYGPHVCFYTYDPVSLETGEITLEPSSSPIVPAVAGWNTMTVVPATGNFFWFGSESGTAMGQGAANLFTLATFQADVGFADHVIDRVQIEFGWWSAGDTDTCYLDTVSLNETDIGLEVSLCPDIAYNVKTAEEEYRLYGFGDCETGIPMCDVSPDLKDWTVIKGCGEGDVEIMAGGAATQNFISVRMVTMGDCHILVELEDDGILLDAEKKWGEIHCTELAKDPLDEFHVIETVYATFLWGDCTTEVVLPADGAVVDWWLMDIDALAAVQALEAALGDDPLPCVEPDGGCGTYLLDFFSYDIDGSGTIDPVTEVFDSPREAMLAIYAEFGTLATPANRIAPDVTLPLPSDDTHETTTTDTDGETFVDVTLAVPTSAILVTLTDYPVDKHGENTVCIQHETWVAPPPPAQVKVPQVRWAGEKIVLEKEWGEEYCAVGYLVMFALEEGSIGDLIPLYADDLSSSDSRTVFTEVQEDGVARVMFKTEQQGQVDVECVLYGGRPTINGADFDELLLNTVEDVLTVIGNHGFLVYYLAFEEILWCPDPEINPEITTLDAGEAIDLLPLVSGWFTSDALPGTLRPEAEQDINGDGIPDFLLPAGRYVLPFDWPLLAGFDLESRPWYDLMDSANLDNVTSVTQLGPWINVNSVDGFADAPSIGPFNTVQQWSLLALWFADATVVADLTVAAVTTIWDALDLRNTVVPNEVLDWLDCPMSQALGKFEIVDGTAAAFTALVAKDKGGFWPYGFDPGTLLFQSPFYEVEIPSHWLIPAMRGTPMGYMWDSWNTPLAWNGPYDYWRELDTSIATTNVIEVYGDNHSFFGCHLPAPTDLLGDPVEGTVILQLTADYPYLPAKFPAITSTIEITWGAPVLHLDADYEADPRSGEAPLEVTFDPTWTWGGLQPYVKAEWDFDGDGVIDLTVEDPLGVDTMLPVTFIYEYANLYTPSLIITDSTTPDPLVSTESKTDYIEVTGGVVMKGDFDGDGDIDAVDFAAFGDAYGSVDGDANYDVIGDFDDDGDIDAVDFAAFGDVYGYGT